MRHDMNGKCAAIRMFGIPGVLEICEAIHINELMKLGVPYESLSFNLGKPANGFMKVIELPLSDNCYGDRWEWTYE